MAVTKELFPRVETFHVGEVVGVAAALEPVIGVLKLLGQAEDYLPTGPLSGLVENFGDDPFDFSVEESENDNIPSPLIGTPVEAADPYVGINIRVAGAGVASVAVVPGARVVFAIEVAEISAGHPYLRFKATAATKKQHGRLAITSWTDDIQKWESRAIT